MFPDRRGEAPREARGGPQAEGHGAALVRRCRDSRETRSGGGGGGAVGSGIFFVIGAGVCFVKRNLLLGAEKESKRTSSSGQRTCWQHIGALTPRNVRLEGIGVGWFCSEWMGSTGLDGFSSIYQGHPIFSQRPPVLEGVLPQSEVRS